MFFKKKIKETRNAFANTDIEENKKILIIGHKLKIKGINSFSWYDIPDDLNLADYDNVLIDFSVIEKYPFPEVENITDKNIWNLIFNKNSELIFIGTPELIQTHGKKNSPYGSFYSPLGLLPFEPEWTKEKGNKINVVDDKYLFYFNFVKEWSFHFDYIYNKPNENKIEKIKQALKFPINAIAVSYTPIATNGYNRPIGCKFNFKAKRTNSDFVIESCPIIWLPPVLYDNKDKAILIILQEMFKQKQNIEKPNWLSSYTLISMEKIQIEISQIDIDIIKMMEKKKNKMSKYEQRERFTRLLYEQGINLEEIVIDALKELDCEILETTNGNNEDIQFKDLNGCRWVVEVKGKKGCLKRDDIRQLDDWVKNLILNKDWKGYAIIIGNYYYEINPKDRDSPLTDTENASIKRFGFTLLTTFELFKAIRDKEKGNYNAKEYWKIISEQCRYFE